MKQGTPVADAITVAKVDIDLLSTQATVSTVLAYVSSVTGKTYGQATLKQGWSKRTMGLLKEFCEAIEEDAAALLLQEGAMEAKGPVRFPSAPSGGGLLDHLNGEEDVPSI